MSPIVVFHYRSGLALNHTAVAIVDGLAAGDMLTLSDERYINLDILLSIHSTLRPFLSALLSSKLRNT